ncbi:MAG: hypothetical protein VX252_17815 [Myxococcota bacterium]|nr:hypothetical protein [Myxococcota bacterium]
MGEGILGSSTGGVLHSKFMGIKFASLNGNRSASPSFDLAAVIGLVAFFLLWHAAGVFGGQVYVAEDSLAYFFSNRAGHYGLIGSGGFSLWDPLPGLGQPRLGNIQSGLLAPVSALFYWFPTQAVFQFYPAAVMSGLAVATYALFRVKGVGVVPAFFGALSWTTTSGVLTHVQHIAVIETLLFLPVTLFFWECAVSRRQGGFAVLAGLALAFQCLGASPQYLVYNGLIMALWMGRDLVAVRQDKAERTRRFVYGLGIAGVGLGLASWQLLPFLEMVQQSHRALLHDPELFSGLFRAAPHEIPLALAAESFAFMPAPLLEHGAPYRNQPQLSLVVLALSAFAMMRKPRPWMPALGAAFFVLGMLGAEGGVTPLLREVFPFADRLRAPYRMIVPASFLLSWLAALGLERLLVSDWRWRRSVAIFCVVWVAAVGWVLKRPLDHYTDAEIYEIPKTIAVAEGRLAVDFAHSRRMPPFAINAGLAAGVPTLLMREVLIPANFFAAYYAGQHGELGPPEAFDRTIVAAALPLENPHAPVFDAFGLRTVVRYRGGLYATQIREGALDRFTLVPSVRVEEDPDRFFARLGSPDWDPRREALVSSPVPGWREEGGETLEPRIQVRSDESDRQSLEVESSGGILVTSGLFFPGWEVRVDGQPAQAIEVQGALRGVALPAGQHRVDWTYRPPWLPWAAAGTVLALLSAVVLLGLGPWERRAASRA